MPVTLKLPGSVSSGAQLQWLMGFADTSWITNPIRHRCTMDFVCFIREYVDGKDPSDLRLLVQHQWQEGACIIKQVSEKGPVRHDCVMTGPYILTVTQSCHQISASSLECQECNPLPL